MEWNFRKVVEDKQINLAALAEQLVLAGIAPNGAKPSSSLETRKLVWQSKLYSWNSDKSTIETFIKVRDPIFNYRVLRRFMRITSEDLFGVKTDMEAEYGILMIKMRHKPEIVEPVPMDVYRKYAGQQGRRNPEEIEV